MATNEGVEALIIAYREWQCGSARIIKRHRLSRGLSALPSTFCHAWLLGGKKFQTPFIRLGYSVLIFGRTWHSISRPKRQDRAQQMKYGEFPTDESILPLDAVVDELKIANSGRNE